jgi:FkbM family methyltransferase
LLFLAGLQAAKMPRLLPKALFRPVTFRPPGIRHPVIIRFGTTDMWVLKQVLLDRQYDFSIPFAPKVIVDAGANIGLSAVFFANKYPDSVIFALEPEESNFKSLEANAAAYPQIKALKMALWSENRQISLIDPKGGDWGFLISEQGGQPGQNRGLVQATNVESLMHAMGVEGIDVLKIDIEGAEKEVFESCSNWIDKVRIIMVELHDQLKPGCVRAFSEATRDFPAEFHNEEIIVRARSMA